jgi:hypothetical protein
MFRHELTLLTVAAISIGISFWALSFNTDRSSSLAATAAPTNAQTLQEANATCKGNPTGACRYWDSDDKVDIRGTCIERRVIRTDAAGVAQPSEVEHFCNPECFIDPITHKCLPLSQKPSGAQRSVPPDTAVGPPTESVPPPASARCPYIDYLLGWCKSESAPPSDTPPETSSSRTAPADGVVQKASFVPNGATVRLSDGTNGLDASGNEPFVQSAVSQDTFGQGGNVSLVQTAGNQNTNGLMGLNPDDISSNYDERIRTLGYHMPETTVKQEMDVTVFPREFETPFAKLGPLNISGYTITQTYEAPENYGPEFAKQVQDFLSQNYFKVRLRSADEPYAEYDQYLPKALNLFPAVNGSSKGAFYFNQATGELVHVFPTPLTIQGNLEPKRSVIDWLTGWLFK